MDNRVVYYVLSAEWSAQERLMTEEQIKALRYLLDLCEEADRNGDGRLSTTAVRQVVQRVSEAPDLLEALIAVRDKRHSEDVWELVNSAIAKATGSQQ